MANTVQYEETEDFTFFFYFVWPERHDQPHTRLIHCNISNKYYVNCRGFSFSFLLNKSGSGILVHWQN